MINFDIEILNLNSSMEVIKTALTRVCRPLVPLRFHSTSMNLKYLEQTYLD